METGLAIYSMISWISGLLWQTKFQRLTFLQAILEKCMCKCAVSRAAGPGGGGGGGGGGGAGGAIPEDHQNVKECYYRSFAACV